MTLFSSLPENLFLSTAFDNQLAENFQSHPDSACSQHSSHPNADPFPALSFLVELGLLLYCSLEVSLICRVSSVGIFTLHFTVQNVPIFGASDS
jgi:hypothetical protein